MAASMSATFAASSSQSSSTGPLRRASITSAEVASGGPNPQSLQKEIGIFNISYRFADLVVYPFYLMNAVMPQLFARHYAASASQKQSLYGDSARLMLLLSIPLLLINIVGGKFFLGWFGNDFKAGYTALVYLSCAQLLPAFFGPAHLILTMQAPIVDSAEHIQNPPRRSLKVLFGNLFRPIGLLEEPCQCLH